MRAVNGGKAKPLVRLRPATNGEEAIKNELAVMLTPMVLKLQLATETSPGELKNVAISPLVDTNKVLELLAFKGVARTVPS